MKVLIAPDSFKDALPAIQVCEAIQRGVVRALPEAQVQIFPLADGGEGTAAVLNWHLGGEMVKLEVSDPLFRPTQAQYLSMQKKAGHSLAYVEMAEASGLQLLHPAERNPLKTSTYGTGELIKEALKCGANELYLAIGGSATNDAGMGMAAALGWQFFDENGQPLLPTGENLIKVHSILAPPHLHSISVPTTVLCDVTNPLCGPNGAAHVFARQKGANDAAVQQLDAGLRHFSDVVAQAIGRYFSQEPGSGAAGGLGFGAMAFLNASVRSGAETIMDIVGFDEALKTADIVITGEGKLDGQTRHGKMVATVGQKARTAGVPVVAICGVVDATAEALDEMGILKAMQLKNQGESLQSSISRTGTALEKAAELILKAIMLQK